MNVKNVDKAILTMQERTKEIRDSINAKRGKLITLRDASQKKLDVLDKQLEILNGNGKAA